MQIDYQKLIYLVVVLCLSYLIYKHLQTKKESMENVQPFSSSKDCSQKAINDGYTYYIFGGPQFIR